LVPETCSHFSRQRGRATLTLTRHSARGEGVHAAGMRPGTQGGGDRGATSSHQLRIRTDRRHGRTAGAGGVWFGRIGWFGRSAGDGPNDRHTRNDRGPDPSRPAAQPTTSRPLPETGPEPGYDRTAFGHSTTVDNKWFPLRPGTRLSYRGQSIEDGERLGRTVTFVVTDLTKVIDGVRNVVIWERDYKDGVLEESELAFFAQADDGKSGTSGNTRGVRGGQADLDTCLDHGVRGARAGITVKAEPELRGRSYSQGWGPAVGLVGPGAGASGWPAHLRCRGLLPGRPCHGRVQPGRARCPPLDVLRTRVGTVRVGFYGKDPTKETLELVSSVV